MQGNPVNRHSLEALRPEGFSSILILADHMEYWAPQTYQGCADNLADADSRCLASLLLLRDIQSSRMHFSNTRKSSDSRSRSVCRSITNLTHREADDVIEKGTAYYAAVLVLALEPQQCKPCHSLPKWKHSSVNHCLGSLFVSVFKSTPSQSRFAASVHAEFIKVSDIQQILMATELLSLLLAEYCTTVLLEYSPDADGSECAAQLV